jgi:hypothetical protein
LDANEAIGDAAAEYRGSTVQLFEKGWMIARFDDDTLYAVVETGPGQMKWFKKSEAEFVKGVVVQGDGKPGDEKLRLGFRWLYFHPVSGDLRQALGRPLTGEIRAWLQFQAFRNGLVIYGVPSTVNDYTDGIFQVVSGIMLFDESHRESGSGKVVKLSEANVKEIVYCSANWYPAVKERTLPPMLKNLVSNGRCDSAHGAEIFTTPHSQIQID